MNRYVNISALADEVLASVAEERIKTASASAPAPTSQYVPVARELLKLADDLRAAPEADEVGDEDLAALMDDPEVMQLLQELEANPELLEQLMAEDGMGSEDPNMPLEDPSMGEDPSAGMDPAMMDPAMAGGDPTMPAPEGDGAGENPFGGGGDKPPAKKEKEKEKSESPKKEKEEGDCDDDDDKDDKSESSPFGGKMGALSRDLRKIAHNLRAQEIKSKQRRLVKAAAMLNAATGLQHLIGGSK